jgi:hypothetical protein
MGLVPGLSSLFGAGPRDLGIRITKQDSLNAFAKIGSELVPLKNTDTIKDFTLEGKKDLTFTMDSKELTAHSNNRPWRYYPLKNAQIKIHQDGTIEGSAILVISKAIPYAMGLGYSEGQIKDAMQKYSIPPFEVPFYIKGKGSVLNDKVSVDAQMVQIGAISIPQDIVTRANGEAEAVLDDIIQKHAGGFHADSVTFANGKMEFKGQVPKKVYVLTE